MSPTPPDDAPRSKHEMYQALVHVTLGTAAMTDDDELVAGIHDEDECRGCWIHGPSSWSLAYAPVSYRYGHFMRICTHHKAHLDRDEIAHLAEQGAITEHDAECLCQCRCCDGDLPPLPAGHHYQLPDDATGPWRMTTEGSRYELDLDAMTWTRNPTPDVRRTRHDGQPRPIALLGTLPRLGRRTLIWYGPEPFTTWILTSPVTSIEQLDEPGSDSK